MKTTESSAKILLILQLEKHFKKCRDIVAFTEFGKLVLSKYNIVYKD